MGVYKNQGHELEDSLINHSQKEVFLGSVDKLGPYVLNGGGIVLGKSLGKFYNNSIIQENYRLQNPITFTESTVPIDLNINAIPRDYTSGVKYEFKATPSKYVYFLQTSFPIRYDNTSDNIRTPYINPAYGGMLVNGINEVNSEGQPLQI